AWSGTAPSAPGGRPPTPTLGASTQPLGHQRLQTDEAGHRQDQGAVSQLGWSTVLLVAGVSTYASILDATGAPEYVDNWAAGLGAAALGALILCCVGGVVSAF